MPDSLCTDVPYDPGNAGIARPIPVQTVTLHRTIGSWPGDYSVGKTRDHNSGTFQFLAGQDLWQVVQFYPVNSFCSHAAGSNEVGPGIELSGQNGEPLTEWQIGILGHILRWLRDEWGIMQVFTDGDPRQYADVLGPLGYITHRHVAYPPNPSYQHYDFITEWEYLNAMLPPPPTPAPTPATSRKASLMAVGWIIFNKVNMCYLINPDGKVIHEYPQEDLVDPAFGAFPKDAIEGGFPRFKLTPDEWQHVVDHGTIFA